MTGGDVEGRERGREPLAFVESRGAIYKRRGEERRRTHPPESIGSVAHFIEAGDVLKRGKEHTESSPNTGLPRPAQELAPEAS